MAELGFDLRQIDETQTKNFDPIPNGIYTVQITGSEAKQNHKRNGSYVKIEFTIVDKSFNGRKLWHNFNLFNPSETAQNIGRAEIKHCILACGLPDTTKDTSYLHGKMLKVKVAIVDQKNEYGLTNVIKDFLPLDGTKQPAPQNAEQYSPQQPAPHVDQFQPVPQQPMQQPMQTASVDYTNAPRPSWMAPITR